MKTLRKLSVRDVYDADPNCYSLLVGPDEEFSTVIRRFADSPELRGIFVVDARRCLLGVITRTDLLDWTRAELGFALSASREKSLRLASLMYASKAGQVMHTNGHHLAAKLTDSLAQTLRRMIDLDLIVLPVVDEDDRVIGDIRLTEILAQTLADNRQESAGDEISRASLGLIRDCT